MNLPQRKKTAEELARLRDELGIPTDPAAASTPPVEEPAAARELEIPEPAPLVKPVKSLRRSEREPVIRTEAVSRMPSLRHTEEELQQIRKREYMAAREAPPPKPPIAHPALIVAGYLAAVTGGILPFFYQTWTESAVCVVIAAAVAGYIFLKKSHSHHHAAFIGIIALLVLVFGALHYFPHLRYVS